MPAIAHMCRYGRVFGYAFQADMMVCSWPGGVDTRCQSGVEGFFVWVGNHPLEVVSAAWTYRCARSAAELVFVPLGKVNGIGA
jgi:hypothetical protein